MVGNELRTRREKKGVYRWSECARRDFGKWRKFLITKRKKRETKI